MKTFHSVFIPLPLRVKSKLPSFMRFAIYSFLFVLTAFISNASKAQSAYGAAMSNELGADALVGTWAPQDGEFHVKIEKIGSKYYGKLIWLANPNDGNGNPKTDQLNPDPALRQMPFIGLRTLRDIEYIGDNVWGKGSIYDPESGKTYDCRITLNDINNADIRGFLGLTVLGKTIPFTRVQ